MTAYFLYRANTSHSARFLADGLGKQLRENSDADKPDRGNKGNSSSFEHSKW